MGGEKGGGEGGQEGGRGEKTLTLSLYPLSHMCFYFFHVAGNVSDIVEKNAHTHTHTHT